MSIEENYGIGKGLTKQYTIGKLLTFGGDMKKSFTLTKVIGCILLAGCIIFAGCEKKSGGLTIKSGVLSIGMEIGYPPMEYYDSDGKTPIGFDVDMGKAIADKLGLKAEFIDVAWDGIFAGVDTNRYDAIMSSVTITDARMDVHNFSHPYIVNTLALVLLKGSPVKARNPEECEGLNVAFQADTTSDFYMQDLEEEIGLRYFPRRYEKVMSCFDELKLGRVDAILTDLPVALDYIMMVDSPFEIVWENPDPEIFGICMKKGNDALTEAVNKAMEELFDEGTLLEICTKHIGMDAPVYTARQLW